MAVFIPLYSRNSSAAVVLTKLDKLEDVEEVKEVQQKSVYYSADSRSDVLNNKI